MFTQNLHKIDKWKVQIFLLLFLELRILYFISGKKISFEIYSSNYILIKKSQVFRSLLIRLDWYYIKQIGKRGLQRMVQTILCRPLFPIPS
jgi:hypothetical protein